MRRKTVSLETTGLGFAPGEKNLLGSRRHRHAGGAWDGARLWLGRQQQVRAGTVKSQNLDDLSNY
jgi:hypothetical protein